MDKQLQITDINKQFENLFTILDQTQKNEVKEMSITIFPDEIVRHIMAFMNGKTLSQLYICSKIFFNHLCRTQFWKERMISDFAYTSCQLPPSFQSYKWFAWIFQQTPEYKHQLDVSKYLYPEELSIELLNKIINIGPQILISLEEVIRNVFDESPYKLNKNICIDIKESIHRAFLPKHLKQIAIESDLALQIKEDLKEAQKVLEEKQKELERVQKSMAEAQKRLEKTQKSMAEAQKKHEEAVKSFRF